MSQVEIVCQIAVCLGGFQGIEVSSLYVLDQRQQEHIFLGCFTQDRRDGLQFSLFGSLPAAFPGDEEVLAFLSAFGQDQRLNYAVFFDRCGKVTKRFGIEVCARLMRVCSDLVDGYLHHASGSRLIFRGGGGEQGAEPFAEAWSA